MIGSRMVLSSGSGTQRHRESLPPPHSSPSPGQVQRPTRPAAAAALLTPALSTRRVDPAGGWGLVFETPGRWATDRGPRTDPSHPKPRCQGWSRSNRLPLSWAGRPRNHGLADTGATHASLLLPGPGDRGPALLARHARRPTRRPARRRFPSSSTPTSGRHRRHLGAGAVAEVARVRREAGRLRHGRHGLPRPDHRPDARGGGPHRDPGGRGHPAVDPGRPSERVGGRATRSPATPARCTRTAWPRSWTRS